MSRTISSTVLPIQRAMAGATPSGWRDGLVVDADASAATVAFLDGSTARLRLVAAVVSLVAGEPVAYHPVAELLDSAHVVTTARVA